MIKSASSILFFFIGLLSFNTVYSQGEVDTKKLPKVFQLGSFEEAFDQLFVEHPIPLLSVCEDNLDSAYGVWTTFLEDMETHAGEIDYDLRSIQVGLSVFWEKDGSIRHLVFYILPYSKNVNSDELRAFFITFIRKYKLPIEYTERFFHDGQASFPTKPELYKKSNE